MDEKKIEKLAWVSVIIIVIFAIGSVMLLGWSIITIVNWLTAK